MEKREKRKKTITTNTTNVLINPKCTQYSRNNCTFQTNHQLLIERKFLAAELVLMTALKQEQGETQGYTVHMQPCFLNAESGLK